ncbi:MAG: hypothetical protein WC592_01860 [Candidatus Omnitrophota bacterium]
MNDAIVGNPLYCFSDESGYKELEQEDNCFCFAVISHLGGNVELLEKEQYKFCERKSGASYNDLIMLNDILTRHRLYANVVYYNFSDSKIRDIIIKAYEARKNSSLLNNKEISSLNNYVWLVSYGLTLVHSIFDIVSCKERINNIFIKYDRYSLKIREREIIEEQARRWIDERLRGVSKAVNRYANAPYFKGEEALVVSISEADDSEYCVKMAHSLANGFRKYYKKDKESEFKKIFQKNNRFFTANLSKYFTQAENIEQKTIGNN